LSRRRKEGFGAAIERDWIVGFWEMTGSEITISHILLDIDLGELPCFPLRFSGPSKRATATYPSRGPAAAPTGLADTFFRLVSKAGRIALISAADASVSSESKDHIAPPTAA
jgi:hypothetical protein